MDENSALGCLAALSQPTRLKAFRLLVAAAPHGIAAGEVAKHVEVPQNTMSAHLAILAHCGLVGSERRSRSIVYRADLARFRAVITFLLRDCCGGRQEVCASILDEFTPCGLTSATSKEWHRA